MSITETQAIEQFVPHLRRFARALLDDRDGADALVRDCLAEAVSRRRQGEPVINLRVWLFAILHDRYRQMQRPLNEESGLGSMEDDQATDGRKVSSARQEPIAGFTVRDFGNAFRQLSVEDQQVLLLIGLEGMSHQETAEVLRVPLGTLMLRLWQVKRRLRGVERRTNGLQTRPVPLLLRSNIARQAGRANLEPHRREAPLRSMGH